MQALAGGAVSFLATEIAPGATASPDGLPVGVRLAGDELVLTRYGDGPAVRVLTFERAGERAAYGAYGLLGAKNGLAVGRPLHGDPVAWDQRDHRAALEHQLALVGLPAQTAAELVAAQDAAWFGDGLRVFFALQRAADVLLVQVEVAPGA